MLQKSYKTLDEHKEGMRRHLGTWNAPSLECLIEATEADSILLSNIYQRQVCCPAASSMARCVQRLASDLLLSCSCECSIMPAAMQNPRPLESIDAVLKIWAINF